MSAPEDLKAGMKVVVTKSDDDFEYVKGDTGMIDTIELKPSGQGGPERLAFVVYDDNQDPGWVHLDALERMS